MKNENNLEKFCRDSRTVQTHLVFPQDTNNHNTLYGGKLMSYIDSCAAITAIRHTKKTVVTASTDRLNFLAPIPANHALTLESFVTGTGKKSLEIFVKVSGEELFNNHHYLAATCFTTFVVVGEDLPEDYAVPKIIPETKEEKLIAKNYQERKKNRLHDLLLEKEFLSDISSADH